MIGKLKTFLLAALLAAFSGAVGAQFTQNTGYFAAGAASGGDSTITSGTTATSGCTAGGVLYSASNLVVCNDTDLTFNGTTLTATGLTVTNAPTFSALTATRIPIAGTAGLLGDNAGLTWPGTAGATLVLAGGTAVTDVAAFSLTRTNNDASVATGVKWTFTDTSSAAGFLPFQILGGAAGTTNLISVGKTGTVTAPKFKITGDSVEAAADLYLDSLGASSVNLRANGAVVLSVTNGGLLRLNTTAFMSTTAPTIASGGCTSPTVTNANGTARVQIDVGTSCSGSQPIVATFPAATTGWTCYARNVTNGATSAPRQTGAISTTSVTITNFAATTGLAAAWTDGDDVEVSCLGG